MGGVDAACGGNTPDEAEMILVTSAGAPEATAADIQRTLPHLRAVTNGLALLPYGNGVHYDSEEQRRPLLHSLVGEDVLPTSYATDDRIGILYEGVEPVEVVADVDGGEDGPAAYRVERSGGQVVEARLPVGRLR